ncbi:MAG TPA: hypothetical protein VMT29_13100 [Steroidobacteraceae bacterium]|nr:hypothetical protein [Steroidobacteraceae bacterium]
MSRVDWRPLALRFAPVALAALGFVVTFLITSRQERVAPLAADPIAPQSRALPRPVVPEPAITPPSTEAAAPQPMRAPLRVAAAPAASAEPPADSAAGGQLPVVTEVREDTEVPIDLRIRSHDGQSGAAVFNRSGEPLHLAITAGNPATGQSSHVDVTLDAHESKELTDVGLAIAPGDQIRVQSPPYKDLILNR